MVILKHFCGIIYLKATAKVGTLLYFFGSFTFSELVFCKDPK